MKNTHSKKLYAFTIVEIIFVIVIIGILSVIGKNFFPDNRLLNDTKYIIMKIREKQKNSIGYSIVTFGKNLWKGENNSTCIYLDKDNLNDLENISNVDKKYQLISNIEVTEKKICFDMLGRPYIPSQEHLLLKNIDINVTKNGKIKQIRLYHISGYATIIK